MQEDLQQLRHVDVVLRPMSCLVLCRVPTVVFRTRLNRHDAENRCCPSHVRAFVPHLSERAWVLGSLVLPFAVSQRTSSGAGCAPQLIVQTRNMLWCWVRTTVDCCSRVPTTVNCCWGSHHTDVAGCAPQSTVAVFS